MRTLGFGGLGRLWELELSVKECAAGEGAGGVGCGVVAGVGGDVEGELHCWDKGSKFWRGGGRLSSGGHRWGSGVRRMSQTQ